MWSCAKGIEEVLSIILLSSILAPDIFYVPQGPPFRVLQRAATTPNTPMTPATTLGTPVTPANPLDAFEPFAEALDEAALFVVPVLVVLVPLNCVVLVPLVEPLLGVIVGKLVLVKVFPIELVYVITLGAPEMLPALAAPLNSSTLLSKLAMFEEYCVGIAVSHEGVTVAVRADWTIEVMSPVILYADATL